MKLEDMKKNIPETPEFIHTMIESEVRKQLQDEKVVNMRGRKEKKWTGRRMAAAVAVCILSTSTIAYAGVKLQHMFLEKQGNYGVITGIDMDDRMIAVGEVNLPEKIHDVDIAANYIPEGMKWIDECHLQYPEHNRTGGFSFAFALLDGDGLNKVMQDKNVVDSEERVFGDYAGVYIKYQDLTEDGSFNQRIYLVCPDVYRVLTVYIGDDIAKEDAIKVVENLVITENDTMVETAGLYTWSAMVSPREEFGEEEIITSITDDKLQVHKIGDTFSLLVDGQDSSGNYKQDTISVCVNSICVEDDLQLLHQDIVPEEWINALGDDGKLVNNTLYYIQSGDGKNVLDKVVKTESVKQKLVYATVTYTNNSEEEIKHMLYYGTLASMKHENGMYQMKEEAGDGYDRIIEDSVASMSMMQYHSVYDDTEEGKNYIPSLKPGESVQVNIAWIVNENDLDNMYLSLDSYGSAYAFTETLLETGLVDIRQ